MIRPCVEGIESQCAADAKHKRAPVSAAAAETGARCAKPLRGFGLLKPWNAAEERRHRILDFSSPGDS
jgi:hypothetical protein